jgi:hypothetical protein
VFAKLSAQLQPLELAIYDKVLLHGGHSIQPALNALHGHFALDPLASHSRFLSFLIEGSFLIHFERSPSQMSVVLGMTRQNFQ